MSLKKEFISFTIPSVLSFAITGLYCFVDAFFVGNKVGDIGLAAINISFCLIAVFQALGSGIGLGASVKYSINKAQGNEKEGKTYIGGAFLLMLILDVLITIPIIIWPYKILLAIGASPYVGKIGVPYLLIQSYGSFIQVYGCGLIPIVRNYNGSKVSMIAVVLGCLWNMVFDYLFVWVFQWGLVGASVATLFGQAITLIVLLIFLGKKKAITFKVPKGQFITIAKDIIIIGLAPFGLSTIPNVSIVILNKATLFYGGEEGLGAYGCIAYLTFIVLLMLQGVGDGAQPLISTYYGKDDFSSLKKLRKYTYIFSLTIALVSMVIEIKLRWKLGPFMGTSSNTTTIVAKALPIFAIAFPLQGIIRATSSILYSTEKALRSYLITYSEPIFILLAIIILCPYFALDGVWFAFTAGQCALMIMSLIL